VKLADVRHADEQAWVSELAEWRSASTVQRQVVLADPAGNEFCVLQGAERAASG
jgi:hypothetical protein